METTHASSQITRHTKLKVTPKFISSNGKQDFRLTTANTIPRTSNDTRCLLNFLITPSLYSQPFPTKLVAQKQTKYSMLQIKTIPKNILTRTSWNFSPLYTKQQLARYLTDLTRKQLNVNTNTLQLSSLKNNNKTPG